MLNLTTCIQIGFIILVCIASTLSLEFKLSSKSDRCFFESFVHKFYLINYNLEGAESIADSEKPALFSNIVFKIYDPFGSVYQYENVKKLNGKFIVEVNKLGEHKICVTYYKNYWSSKLNLSLGFKVTSKYSKIETNDPLLHEHVEEMHFTLKNAIDNVQNTIDLQEDEIMMEDQDAAKIEQTAKNFRTFIYIQMFAIAGLLIYQIIRARGILRKIVQF